MEGGLKKPDGWVLDYGADKLQKRELIPDDLSYEQIADEVIRGKRTLSPQQIRLLIEIYPYYRPKLTAIGVAHYEGSFADLLDKAIERSQRPLKLIDAKPVEVHPASELKGPFARMRRRV
jgi:hypothetical protein